MKWSKIVGQHVTDRVFPGQIEFSPGAGGLRDFLGSSPLHYACCSECSLRWKLEGLLVSVSAVPGDSFSRRGASIPLSRAGTQGARSAPGDSEEYLQHAAGVPARASTPGPGISGSRTPGRAAIQLPKPTHARDGPGRLGLGWRSGCHGSRSVSPCSYRALRVRLLPGCAASASGPGRPAGGPAACQMLSGPGLAPWRPMVGGTY